MEKEARWKRHFHKSQLFMEHPDPSRFTRGPWHPGPEPAHAAFLAYRITMSLIFLSGLLWSTLDHWESGLWLVFLTNWGFITCTAQSFLATAIVFKAFRKQRSSGDSTIDLTEDKQMPMSYKVYWVLYNISLTVAFFISILYWAVLYNPKEDAGSRNPFFLNFTMHAANSLLCLVELAVGGPPSRFLHVTQPIGFAFVYAIFNVTYWAAGGLGPFDRHFIYPILDWDKNPGLAVGILLASCVLMVLLHSAVCGLSSIRKILSRRFKRKKDNNVVTTNLPNLSAGNFNKGFVA